MPASSGARRKCARCATAVDAAEQQRESMQAELAGRARERLSSLEQQPRCAAGAKSIACIARTASSARRSAALRTQGRADCRAHARDRLPRPRSSSAITRIARGARRSARAACRKAWMQMAQFEDQRVELEQERDELRQNLGFKRSQAQTDRDGAQEVAIKVESKRSALTSISAGLERLRHQLDQLQLRRDELTRQLAKAKRRWQALSATLEAVAAAARRRRAGAGGGARSARRRRNRDAHAAISAAWSRRARVEEARARLEDVRMAAQELKVRRETLLEQFARHAVRPGDRVPGNAARGGRARVGADAGRHVAARSSAWAR